MFLDINGISLFYETKGGDRTLILLHGNGENHHIFDKLAEKLKSNFKVYLIDSRNHGKSEKTNDYSYHTMAEDLYCFIKTLGTGKVDIAGFSDGGITALLLAMKHCELVDKIALMGINLKPEDFTEENYQYIKKTYENTKDPLFKLMLEEPQIALDELRRLSCPVLVIGAENDLFKPHIHTDIAKAIPNARLKIIKGHDHGSYIVNNDMLYTELVNFFKNR